MAINHMLIPDLLQLMRESEEGTLSLVEVRHREPGRPVLLQQGGSVNVRTRLS